MEKKKKFKLTLKQWAICYAGSLGFGGLAWWATRSPWIGGGVLIAFTAAYVFYLAGKVTETETRALSTEGLSRQQRRALERKVKAK
jgi:hypothetical protein